MTDRVPQDGRGEKQVQNWSNLSVLSVLLCDLALPTVPPNQ
jgi:hypothetical protein